jgi:hypothetical protein
METTWSAADTQTTAEQDRHTRPLDTLLVALSEAKCGTCEAIMHMLKAHLEVSIPAWPKGGVR